jgi:hypothetical protein
MDEQEERLDKVITLLWGNGSPEKGLVLRMDRIEHAAAAIAENVQSMREMARKFFWTVLFAVLATLGTIAANSVAAHWR